MELRSLACPAALHSWDLSHQARHTSSTSSSFLFILQCLDANAQPGILPQTLLSRPIHYWAHFFTQAKKTQLTHRRETQKNSMFTLERIFCSWRKLKKHTMVVRNRKLNYTKSLPRKSQLRNHGHPVLDQLFVRMIIDWPNMWYLIWKVSACINSSKSGFKNSVQTGAEWASICSQRVQIGTHAIFS